MKKYRSLAFWVICLVSAWIIPFTDIARATISGVTLSFALIECFLLLVGDLTFSNVRPLLPENKARADIVIRIFFWAGIACYIWFAWIFLRALQSLPVMPLEAFIAPILGVFGFMSACVSIPLKQSL